MEHTKQSIAARLDVQWSSKKIAIDWTSYETIIIDIMKAEMTCGEKLALLKEALDAYTKRGHFIGEYL